MIYPKWCIVQLNNAPDKLPTCSGNLNRSLLINDDIIEEFLNNYKIRCTIDYREFISTTKMKMYDESANVQIHIIDLKSGKDIFIINRKEKEVLYKSNSSFVVENKKYIMGLRAYYFVNHNE